MCSENEGEERGERGKEEGKKHICFFLHISLSRHHFAFLPLLPLSSLHKSHIVSHAMATSTQETKPGTGPMEAKKRNVPWAVLKGLLLGLLALVVKKAYDAGEFRAMEYHGGERCTPWRGAVGMEDVAFYRPPLQKNEKTIAVLSSDVRRYLNLGFDLSGQSFADRIASQKVRGCG